MPIMYSGGSGNIGSAQITDGAITDADINAAADIALSKLAGVSGTDKVLGRASPGAGPIEEIVLTNAGRQIINAAAVADVRSTIGAAASGANTDITSLGSLSTPLSEAQGGTGEATRPTRYIGAGKTSNTFWENFELLFGAATAVFGWTSVSTPTYAGTHLGTGSAQGVTRPMPINLATGVQYNWSTDTTKKKILEWDALIAADAHKSLMGFTNNQSGNYTPGNAQNSVMFHTDASGNWFITIDQDATHYTDTQISTPAAGRHTFRIEYSPGVSATFYIDGVSVGTLNTVANMPVANVAYNITMANGTSGVVITALGAPLLSMEK